jgi:hypothetical protein
VVADRSVSEKLDPRMEAGRQGHLGHLGPPVGDLDGPLVQQRGHQLGDEQRVAAGRGHPGHEPGRGLGADGLGHQLGHGVGVELAQGQAARPGGVEGLQRPLQLRLHQLQEASTAWNCRPGSLLTVPSTTKMAGRPPAARPRASTSVRSSTARPRRGEVGASVAMRPSYASPLPANPAAAGPGRSAPVQVLAVGRADHLGQRPQQAQPARERNRLPPAGPGAGSRPGDQSQPARRGSTRSRVRPPTRRRHRPASGSGSCRPAR